MILFAARYFHFGKQKWYLINNDSWHFLWWRCPTNFSYDNARLPPNYSTDAYFFPCVCIYDRVSGGWWFLCIYNLIALCRMWPTHADRMTFWSSL